jgi:alpha-tubulin suppressor-like RCC1 family protein
VSLRRNVTFCDYLISWMFKRAQKDYVAVQDRPGWRPDQGKRDMTTTLLGRGRRLWMTGLLAVLAALPLAALAQDSGSGIPSPEGGSRVVSLDAGGLHSCALKADGSVACWGYNDDGETAAPSGSFVSVSAGEYHSCGLKSDGSVDCWGWNDNGQAVDQTGPFVSVSAGTLHTCGVKSDGSVYCWGENGDRQAAAPPGPFISVSAGWSHTCGLKSDGSVACWGRNLEGQAVDQAGPFVSVSAGAFHTCGVKADGSVACWGNNGNGRATAPSGSFVSVSANFTDSCGVRPDGSVDCWGSNEYGKAADQTGPFVSVSAGEFHTCGLKADGSVACWGAGGVGTSDYPHYGQSTVPAGLGALGFGQIAAGNAHACQLKPDGTIACWGDNTNGQTNAPEGMFASVVAGDSHSCALGADGMVTCWGRNGANNQGINTFAGDAMRYRQLAASLTGTVCGLSSTQWRNYSAGTPVCSFLDSNGQVLFNEFQMSRNITHAIGNHLDGICVVSSNGSGACISHPNDIPPPPASSWQRLESGLNHQCGLKANGTLACWGNNSEGQTSNVPTGQFRALGTGYNHACAIRENGTLACWGSNLNGQATPPTGTFVQVSAGNTFTCAIRNTGTRVCWGAGAGVAVALVPGTLPNGVAGTAYSQQFSLSGDAANLPANPVYGVSSGSLPPGLSLSAGGLLSGTPTSVGTFTFSIDAEGDGDFGASQSYSITIADSTPPVISYTLSPEIPNGLDDWYTSSVGIDWTVSDPESAYTITNGCVDSTLSTDTAPAGTDYSCSASSAGGSTGPVTVTLKRDATKPTIAITPSPAANAAGWNKADVSLLVNCGDATPGSGIASCPSLANVTTEGSTIIPAQTASDNAGNTSAATTALTVKLDKTAPTITAAAAPTAPDGANGWYRSNVTVAFTCNDVLSGVVSCPANQILSTDGSAVSSSAQTVSDKAGNTSAPSNVVTVKLDKTAPTLAPTMPSPLLRGGSYTASPNASDAMSGIATSSCGALDTSTSGSKSTTCSATDNAGNSKTVTLNYTVTTTCSNDGYTGTQLTWCRNICEMGYTGATLDIWIHRWINRYRALPYCRVTAPQLQ